MKFDLEERLIIYAVNILDVIDLLPDNKGATHLAGQLIRSGTSPALNYGEAQGAESRKDFIHKMKGSLKELRESSVCLKIIDRKRYAKDDRRIKSLLAETHELTSIFVKSIQTAEKNLLRSK